MTEKIEDISMEIIADLLIDGVEEVIVRWGRVEGYVVPKKKDRYEGEYADLGLIKYSQYPLSPGGRMVICGLEDQRVRGVVKLETIESGLKTIKAEHPELHGKIKEGNWHKIDADEFIQIVIFNEVKFKRGGMDDSEDQKE